MEYKINTIIRELIYVMGDDGDAVTGLVNSDFSKSLYKDGVLTTETITVTEKAEGYYWVTFTPESIGDYTWQVSNATYQPEGWYDYHLVKTNDVDDVKTDTANLVVYSLRLLGLHKENTYIDTTVYDDNHNMTSARLRIYSVKGSVGTSSDVLETYTVTATFNVNSELQTYQMVRI